jgi:predicted RNA-binding protein with PUA-like domain
VAYWLFKSEPSTWGWEDQVEMGDIGQEWDGVRNYQARNNMRAMKTGDLGFFYHSQTEKAVVGIVRVTAESHPDSTTDDDRWDCVDVVAVRPVRSPVTLDDVKAEPRLKNMVLANNTRLSVQPVTDEEWKIVCGMAGLDPEKL